MTLQRKLEEMPDDVLQALQERNLRAEYDRRPAFQRNDYLRWIGKAKRPETRQKRKAQMCDELKDGGLYMKMRWDGGGSG